MIKAIGAMKSRIDRFSFLCNKCLVSGLPGRFYGALPGLLSASYCIYFLELIEHQGDSSLAQDMLVASRSLQAAILHLVWGLEEYYSASISRNVVYVLRDFATALYVRVLARGFTVRFVC